MNIESKIAGMTVNERLHHFGLLADFDAAIKACNEAAAIEVLTQARFSPEQAEYMVSRVLSAPEGTGISSNGCARVEAAA